MNFFWHFIADFRDSQIYMCKIPSISMAYVNQNEILMQMLLPMVAVAVVVLRLVSEQVPRGALSAVLTAASLEMCGICVFAATRLLADNLLVKAVCVLLFVFAVTGMRMYRQVWRNILCAPKRRWLHRGLLYLSAALLRAPWGVACAFSIVGSLIVIRWGAAEDWLSWVNAVIAAGLLFCLSRLFFRKQRAAAQRACIISIPVLLNLVC